MSRPCLLKVNSCPKWVEEKKLRGVFIIRDPRDVAVSLCHYIMREPRHWCHTFFREVLSDDSSRLMATICGMDEPHLDSIDKHFRRKFGYLSHPQFCIVRFEELIGSAGGGDDRSQQVTIQKIADHLQLSLTAQELRHITSRAFWRNSPTFRKGQIGAWKQEMQEEHKEAFGKVAGQLLLELGYEEGLERMC